MTKEQIENRLDELNAIKQEKQEQSQKLRNELSIKQQEVQDLQIQISQIRTDDTELNELETALRVINRVVEN